MSVVGGKQGHAPHKKLASMKPLFVSVKCNGNHKTSYKDEVKSGHPPFLEYYPI